MQTYEEFEASYRKYGKLNLVTTVRVPSKPLNPRQLRGAYDKYCKNFEKSKKLKVPDGPSPESVLRKELVKTTGETCKLAPLLSEEDLALLKQNAGGFFYKIDMAHVFGKGAHPKMKLLIYNVVMLNHFSHLALDNCKHPVTGKPISREERETWWKLIIGAEKYEQLKEISLE